MASRPPPGRRIAWLEPFFVESGTSENPPIDKLSNNKPC
jgi:hypothetical protein